MPILALLCRCLRVFACFCVQVLENAQNAQKAQKGIMHADEPQLQPNCHTELVEDVDTAGAAGSDRACADLAGPALDANIVRVSSGENDNGEESDGTTSSASTDPNGRPPHEVSEPWYEGYRTIHLAAGEQPDVCDSARMPWPPPLAFMVVPTSSSLSNGAAPGIYFGTPAESGQRGLREVRVCEDQTVILTATQHQAIAAAVDVHAPLTFMGPRECAGATIGECLVDSSDDSVYLS